MKAPGILCSGPRTSSVRFVLDKFLKINHFIGWLRFGN